MGVGGGGTVACRYSPKGLCNVRNDRYTERCTDAVVTCNALNYYEWAEVVENQRCTPVMPIRGGSVGILTCRDVDAVDSLTLSVL